MSVDETRTLLEAYWEDNDPRYLAENAADARECRVGAR
jgi:hypothetical protein